MSAPETDLIPDERIEQALAPERPEPGDFAAGVRARIAERESAGASDCPPAFLSAPLEQAPSSNPDGRPLPTWLRRAAAILPPGVIDIALLGKLSPAVGGAAKTAPAWLWIAAPWAILLVAAASLAGAMRLTSTLSAANSAGLLRRGNRNLATRGPAAIFSALLFLAPFGLLLFAIFHSQWDLVGFVFLLLAVGVAAAALSLSRAGIADRTTVATVVRAGLGQFVGIAFMLPMMLQGHAGPLTTYGLPPLLVVSLVGIGLMGDRPMRRRARWAGPFMLLLAVAFPLLANYAIEVPFGRDVAELEQWVEDFDEPTSALMEWAALGHARETLGPERFDRLDTSRAAEAIQVLPPKRERLHPMTALGAWRCGLLNDEDLIDYRRTELLIRNDLRDGSVKSYLRDSDLLELVAMHADGSLTDERLAVFRAGVEDALPEPGTFGAVTKARIALDCAKVLGIGDFGERHRSRIHAILLAAWCSEGTSYAVPGGFGNIVQPDGADAPHLHPTTTATLEAVETMNRLGAPEGVDLSQVATYLRQQAVRPFIQEPLIGDVEAALALHLMGDAFALPGPSLTDRLRAESIFFAALLMAGLSLWVVWRAPKVASTEEGPLGASGRRTRA
ncbi:hypothetical protein [Engelhardtia mirabilis]|uniref:Uncharacterized protein n=1 Tax=Engelhardtia mirabilis TaxID=2528011 RepID=A0A518BGC9_9BACT|nr:hypothetical protein Pla133_10590 [Planctomycetes bacterium Pla133]QDV00319.1 hypothetical protein Pla86_10580 [Planctomycetes bacterium Pla86]